MVIQSFSTLNNQSSYKSPTNLLNHSFKAAQSANNQNEVKKQQEPKEQKKPSAKLKAGVLASTLIGVASVYTAILAKKGFNLKNVFKVSPKNWGIFKATYEDKEMPGLITKLAFGSVGGGLIGGAIFDKKENMKSKYKEAVIQIVGNIFVPLGFVFGGVTAYKKIDKSVQNAVKSAVKSPKLANVLSKIPSLIAQTGSLIAGIFIGNRVGNLINQKVFHSNEDRKLKLTDMAPHVDDVCAAVTMMDPTSVVGKFLARIVPVALAIGGYNVGIAQEKNTISTPSKS